MRSNVPSAKEFAKLDCCPQCKTTWSAYSLYECKECGLKRFRFVVFRELSWKYKVQWWMYSDNSYQCFAVSYGAKGTIDTFKEVSWQPYNIDLATAKSFLGAK